MIIPILGQYPAGIALRIIKLPRPHCPDKGGKSDAAQNQRHRYQNGQDLHQRNLKAFSDTVIDDSDIARAAANGVAAPISASGTAMTL